MLKELEFTGSMNITAINTNSLTLNKLYYEMYLYQNVADKSFFSAHKIWMLIVIAACFFLFSTPFSRAKAQVSNNFPYGYNKTKDKGKDQSSLTEGSNYLNILDISGDCVPGNFDYFFNIDARFTDDSERVNSNDGLYDIVSYTLDWEYTPFPNLNLTGESSFADTTLSPSADAADTEMGGYAHKLTATGDGRPGRFTFQYERISPDYRSVVGSAISDREKAKLKWRYEYNDKHTIKSAFIWYRNNLNGAKDTRSDHFQPKINLITQDLLGRKHASTDISYKLDITKLNKAIISRVDHIVNLNYKDRFGIFDTDSNLGFSSYEHKGDTKQKNLEYIYNISLNANFDHDPCTLKPRLHFGGWTSKEELSNISDKIFEYSFGTDLEIPSVKIKSNIQIGQNRLEKENGIDSLNSFARLDLYYKSDFLSKTQNGIFFLKAYINDFNFDNGDKDYRESSITSGINIEF